MHKSLTPLRGACVYFVYDLSLSSKSWFCFGVIYRLHFEDVLLQKWTSCFVKCQNSRRCKERFVRGRAEYICLSDRNCAIGVSFVQNDCQFDKHRVKYNTEQYLLRERGRERYWELAYTRQKSIRNGINGSKLNVGESSVGLNSSMTR